MRGVYEESDWLSTVAHFVRGPWCNHTALSHINRALLLSNSPCPQVVNIKTNTMTLETNMFRTTATLISFAALTACNTPNPPTVSAADVDRAFAEARTISNLPFTDTNNLPTGTVTYVGKIGADVSGDYNGSILGDMRMNIDFADSDVGGDVTNINLIGADGRPDQRFDGSLDIDGVADSGRIDAFASGDITAVNDIGLFVDSNVLLRLDGDVYDDFAGGDAVFGTVKGDAEGEFDLNIDGVFFGTSD